MDNAAALKRAKLVCRHAQKFDVVRQEVSGDRLKDRECAGKHQTKTGEGEKGAAVTQQRIQQTSIVTWGWHGVCRGEISIVA